MPTVTGMGLPVYLNRWRLAETSSAGGGGLRPPHVVAVTARAQSALGTKTAGTKRGRAMPRPVWSGAISFGLATFLN